MGDSVRLSHLPDWIKNSIKKPEGRRQFIERILAEALHRQAIYPGKIGDRTLSVTYAGRRYYLEETRSDKLNLKSWRDWLYTKNCWRMYGEWVTEAPPKNSGLHNWARFKLYSEGYE